MSTVVVADSMFPEWLLRIANRFEKRDDVTEGWWITIVNKARTRL